MFLEYDELVDIFKEEASKISNLKKYCFEHDLESGYNLLVLINNRSKTPKKYSKLIIKFLATLGYHIEKKSVYSIERYHGNDSAQRDQK